MADAAQPFAGSPIDRDEWKGAPDPDSPPIADRMLILAGGPEGWPEFFGLLALVQRCASVRVLVPEPDFDGRGTAGEEWVGVWEKALGVEQRPVEEEDPEQSCSGVAGLWAGGEGSAERADVLVGRSRTEEMEIVAEQVARLLSEGSDNIAVVFPKAGAGQARLARLLQERGIAFADLIGVSGTPPVDTRIQRALADFYERGCRLEELLSLWPLLRATNLTQLSPGLARAACQDLFDRVQSHAIEPHVARLTASEDPDSREVGRVALLLLPSWPTALTPREALERFASAIKKLGLVEPEGWSALGDFAARVEEPLPLAALLRRCARSCPRGDRWRAAGAGAASPGSR